MWFLMRVPKYDKFGYPTGGLSIRDDQNCSHFTFSQKK